MSVLNQLSKEIHQTAKDKGFWDEQRNTGELLMLVVSELSEGLEALRKDRKVNVAGFAADMYNADIDINEPLKEGFQKIEFCRSFESSIKDTFEDEIADAIIRLLDMCGAMKIDIDFHIMAKRKYNETRPYKHGKKF